MDTLIDQLQSAPMERSGFEDALRRQCEALGFRTGAHVELTVGTLPSGTTLVPGAYEALYRFAQEALANVGRHARAKRVIVRLAIANGLLDLSITDDGVGFDPDEKEPGMGLRNMKTRAAELGGTCGITSTRDSGTTVQCIVPVASASPVRRAGVALAWAALSGFVGFLLYSAGGVNDQGTPAIDLGLQFLRVFGIAVGIGVLLIAVGSLLRAALRFDMQLVKALTQRADLNRHR
jgi:hypothetical protein